MARSSNRSSIRLTSPQQQQQSDATQTIASGAAAGLGSALGNAGGMTLTTCTQGDNSFYCQFVRGFNIFKMVLFIIGVLIILYVLYSIWATTKTAVVARRGRR